jgi:hypothetical protein
MNLMKFPFSNWGYAKLHQEAIHLLMGLTVYNYDKIVLLPT